MKTGEYAVGGYETYWLESIQSIISAAEEAQNFLTVPEEACLFVEKTQVDSLAVSIGNASGFYKTEPTLDLERLENIRDKVDVPLVLHGGTGIPERIIRQAIKLGIHKINIATLMKSTFVNGIKSAIAENPDTIDARKLLDPVKENLKKTVLETFNTLRCTGKGWEK